MSTNLSRRRFIGISAAATGLGLVPLGAAGAPPASAAGHLVVWHGTALGAVATLQIHHRDRAAAERLVARALAEVRRLEGLFSLYRDDSLLVALNRRGVIEAPPAEFVRLLEESLRFARLTDGAFDPTVQPLWQLYAAHFSKSDADPEGPPAGALEATLARIGHRHLVVGRDRIAFARRGMALTLNGIAQGYVTDRVVDLLRAEGIESSLVDMGEARAFGHRPDGAAWTAGILDPQTANAIAVTLPLDNRAVATSGGYGFRFDPAGRFDHLFDPHTGRSPGRYASVSVVMPTACAADALSTAFSMMSVENIEQTLSRLDHAGAAYLAMADGGTRRLGHA